MMMVDTGSHGMDRSEDSAAPPGPPDVPPGNVPHGPPDVLPGPPEGTPPAPPVDVPRRRVQPPRPFGA